MIKKDNGSEELKMDIRRFLGIALFFVLTGCATEEGRLLRDAKNVQKTRIQVARCHEKVANARKDTCIN